MAATCTDPGCDRDMRSNGLCGTCYARHRRHGTLPPRTRNVGVCNETCTAPEGCDNLVGRDGGRGLCSKHYQRLTKIGTLEQPTRTAPLEIRFRAMVSGEPCQCGCDGCELWTGGINPNTGYGNFSIGDKSYLAHRVAWELATSKPIPDGLHIDHVYAKGCRHRHCVKLTHLEPVTQAVNNRRIGETRGKREAWLSYIAKHPQGVRSRDMAEAMSIRTDQAQQFLAYLCREGLIQRIGRGLYAQPGQPGSLHRSA